VTARGSVLAIGRSDRTKMVQPLKVLKDAQSVLRSFGSFADGKGLTPSISQHACREKPPGVLG
jgi:hypothetical protein